MLTEGAMASERPILFSGEMVRAILEGRKYQTRRVVTKWNTPWTKHCADPEGYEVAVGKTIEKRPWTAESAKNLICPYGRPGDSLWVRETWAAYHLTSTEYDEYDEVDSDYHRKPENGDSIVYRADGKNFPDAWRPSIFMPRWASRVNLEVTHVRVERIQDICGMDCIGEGIKASGNSSDGEWRARKKFKELWDSINGKRGFGWEANPWVWAIYFKL